MREGGAEAGGSSGDGAEVAWQPGTIPNMMATLADLMGIDHTTEVISPVGRPIAVSDAGTPVEGLIG